MKKVLFAVFMFTASVSVVSVPHASAYAAAAPVTETAFTAKVNTMDAQIGAGNITAAQATWTEIHDMMLAVLATSKENIRTAATPTAEAAFRSELDGQINLYQTIWQLKSNLATNRAAIHAKLGEFAHTI